MFPKTKKRERIWSEQRMQKYVGMFLWSATIIIVVFMITDCAKQTHEWQYKTHGDIDLNLKGAE